MIREQSRTIRRIGVVIPARNEQRLLPSCLAALDHAAELSAVPVSVVVVLDSCTDNSAAAVESATARFIDELHAVPAGLRNVGRARELGCRRLVEQHGCDGLWLATSDADSTVPHDWFARQLAHFQAGADVVVGTVQVADWRGHSAAVRRRYLDLYFARDGHRHTHGANLSMTASSYLRAGGFPGMSSDEDVAMVDRLVGAGAQIAWAGDLPVLTSARLNSRAPAGFAQFLGLLTEETEHAREAEGVLTPEAPAHEAAL